MKFTMSERRVLTEVYRRLNYFHKGDVNTNLLLLAYPSECKTLKAKGILKPFSTEQIKCLNWYSLTDTGKKLFPYPCKISEDENLRLFERKEIFSFTNNL